VTEMKADTKTIFRKRLPLWKRRRMGTVYLLGSLGLAFLCLAQVVPRMETDGLRREMRQASRIMIRALEKIRECRESRGILLDPVSDVNRTGLVGVEHSCITTSLGHLPAKRTSTSPEFAALVVFLLHKAGVESGDAVAVGASGSFPALIVAVLSAARAMGVHPLLLPSLGASQWGANHPRFHWLVIQECLRENGVFPLLPVAVSMGGENDRGEDMEEGGRILLLRAMEESRLPVIQENVLSANVQERMFHYLRAAGSRNIKAFVNIGGSWANLGTDPLVLHLRPGLVRVSRIPPRERRGVVYEMASRGIPVIHLLHVRGLVRRHGLAWDPVPLPRPGESVLFRTVLEDRGSFFLFGLSYLVLFACFLFVDAKAGIR